MGDESSKKYTLTYEDTTFFGLLKIFGFKRAFLNWSMAFSLLFMFLINLIVCLKGIHYYYSLAELLGPTILGSSATVFGIVLAALAVTISLFHPSILPSMLEEKLLHRYLFPFWKAVALWGVNMVLSLFLIILTQIELKGFFIVESILSFNLLLFLYSTFYTVKISGLVVQLTLYWAQLKK
ncbi:hypothetical protein [Bacillus sp. B4EP4a]|uniref:hypothetical protein n=1 Tax=Bacillus sp. B4EP4a TaxID=2590665 RepID=UPI0011538273|nr:hypothetical protein [Bacillus sp. B4EP4a]